MPEDKRVQTIEQTSKFWKVGIAAGVCLMLLGFIAGLASYKALVVLEVLGILITIGAKSGAWWENG